MKREPVRKIIFVFLVFTIVSSLLTVAFVTGNLAFATSKNKDDSSGGGGDGSKDKGGGSGGSDNGGGGGTDNSGSGSGDTSNTSTPPSATEGNTPTTEETTPHPAAEENTAAPPPPTPAAENQQQPTCPDGSTPDENGKCPPTTTLAPNQPLAAQDGGHILVMSNPDGSCPAGSHKFPGSQVCEKDTVPPTSGDGTTAPASNAPPLTPQQRYEQCLRGIGGGIPGNCKPPTSTEQKLAPLQTLSPQQTCKDGSTPDANGICQDGSTPICPGGGGRDLKGACLPPLPPCPNGKVEDSQGNCVSPEDRRGQLIEPPCGQLGYIRVHGICYQGRETIPNPDGRSCPPDIPILLEGRCLDKLPIIPGSSTGTGGGFIQMLPVKPDGSIGTSGPVVVYVPVNKDGSCPPGDEPASGGYCRHKIQSTGNTPPAAPPTNTPPAQPQPPQQLAPSQPECVPGFHWDNAQLKCVAG